MKRTLLTLGVALVLSLSAGCGGLSKDEKTAAKNISTRFAGATASKARKQVSDCFSTSLVSQAGTARLKQDKVLDDNLKAAAKIPDKLSKTTAEAYAEAIVSCYDFTKLKADIKKSSGATDAQVGAYVRCLDAIDRRDFKQAIVDDYTKSSTSAASRKINNATAACGKLLGG